MKKIIQQILTGIVPVFLSLFLIVISPSCKKYLDAKTDKSLVIPSTVEDAQALLDNYQGMNQFFPFVGNLSDDNFYLTDSYFNTQSINYRNYCTWAKEAVDETDWNYMYGMVLNADIAIETINKQSPSLQNSAKANNIKGQALFFRALGLYNVVQYYAAPYDSSTAAKLPGIPLRLSSDATIISTRATLEQSWQQIVSDLKLAIDLLPFSNTILSRPNKISAYAALAEIFLDMSKFKQAGSYADSSLQLNHTLIDYNTLDTTKLYPFTRFNSEVLFSSVTQNIAILTLNNYIVDSLLFQSYDSNDLRRKLYFANNGKGTVGFTGSYDGSSSLFNGIATDEVYLIKAECEAREGLTDNAMAVLNTLLVTRWITGTFIPFIATNADEALNLILTERRKELILRSKRWFDLRRLNKETNHAKTLTRLQNGITYTLPPGDPRYVFPIPVQAVSITGMEQNAR
jgi:starch-binding outer membrane protein, SusD/RagB family